MAGDLRPLRGQAEWWVPALFAIFSGIWIYGSDALVASIAASVEHQRIISTYKGFGYVITAAVLLHLGMRAALHRERTEARRILEARQFNEQIINGAQEGVIVYDQDLRHLVWNPFMERLTGYPASAVLGKRAQEVFPFLKDTGFPARLRRNLAGEDPADCIDFSATLANGSEQGWISALTAPLRNTQGEVIGVLAFVRDDTARKLAEDSLQEREERYRTFFTHGPDGVLVLDPETKRPIEFNDQVCRQLGYTREEFGNLTLADIEAVESTEDSANRINKIMANGYGDFETLQRTKQGDLRTIHVTAQYIKIGGRSTYHCVWRDNTDRKRAEAENASLQAQLQQSQKMDSLGTLAGGIAHDMNNVLGAILGLASAHIGTQPYGSPLHRALDTICKATERGGKMVKSLLSFARQSPVEDHKLDVNEILREEIHLLERTTLAKVRLELDLAPELRPIRGDASALTHALMNLCVNAVDAMPENGTLTLRTRNLNKDWVEVTVEDTGAGMPKEVLEKALDPFFTTKGVGKGTGLGLSMVYSTMKAHRGQLELLSEPGQGTRVILRFPVDGTENPAGDSNSVTQTETPRVAMKVLLVDDDELIQSSVQTILEILGHAVATAPCGEEALAKLEAGYEPDLVILDMNMPGLSGVGTLPRIRTLLPMIPIVLSTGRTDQTALTLASNHPGVTLLAKPYGLRELQRLLDTLA
jgi:PAS domain S-box-containing protein